MNIILYHGACPDGFTAAWVAYKKFGGEGSYIPVLYGQEPPSVGINDEVFILDFSYPRDVLLHLKQRCKSLVVLDHHKTAEEDLKGLDFCVFDMLSSGARLAWNYFFPNSISPLLIDYIEDHDLWRFKLPDSKLIRAYRQSIPFNFGEWSALSNDIEYEYPRIITMARAMQKLRTSLIMDMAKSAVVQVVGGMRMPVVNCSILFSEVAEYLLETTPFNCAAYYFDRSDGFRQWGMRSKNGFDCSKIAQLYGGGGHKESAGFQTKVPPVLL